MQQLQTTVAQQFMHPQVVHHRCAPQARIEAICFDRAAYVYGFTGQCEFRTFGIHALLQGQMGDAIGVPMLEAFHDPNAADFLDAIFGGVNQCGDQPR